MRGGTRAQYALLRLLPLLGQLRATGRGAWSDDLIAGIIAAILLVPQSMAYAVLAGLPPEMGLYASIIPPLAYALFGTSRVLGVGPVAVLALMVANALNDYSGGDRQLWLSGAVILAAEGGLFLALLGIFRLGVLVNFISHPVLSGFTSGAAVLIITSQIKHLLGIDLARGGVFETLQALTSHFDELHVPTLTFGLAALIVLLAGRSPLMRLLQRIGMDARGAGLIVRTIPLVVVILATLAAALLDAESIYGLAVVGTVPAGLPVPSLDFLSAPGWRALLPSAVLIALMGYVESVSLAKVLAARRRQKVDANRELVALGMSNLAAAVVGTLPVAGGFSRSVVNFDVGARTQLAGIITAGLIGVVALFFTGWFYSLPDAVLAAIIVVAVAQLIDVAGARRVWAYDRADGAALAVTGVAVLGLGIELGLLMGIVLSLALYLWRTGHPHIVVVGRLPGTEHFRNVNRYVAQTNPQVLAVRIDESIYFANAAQVEDFITRHLAAAPDTQKLLLVMAAVNYIDASGLEMLEHLEEALAHAGIVLYLAEVKGPVQDRLRPTRLGQRIAERTYLTAGQAFEAFADTGRSKGFNGAEH
ncbi:MAG: sulfate permease [Nitrococcus mobilis]|nr:sulfate permease [Nitrococcus mobilis]